MDHLFVDPRFQAVLAASGLTSFAAVVRRFAADRPAVDGVWRHPLPLPRPDGTPLEVFYKQYVYAPPTWRFWGRHSKAHREFINYAAFERIGLRCPARVATGEQRDRWGRLQRGLIITEAIPDALPLDQFVRQVCPPRAGPAARQLRDALLAELAAGTRRLHAAGFCHNDLYWRNILVTPSPPALWWIDCPRGHYDRWSPRRHHRQLKDLACLDRIGAQLATAAERVRFVLRYLGQDRLDARAKRLLRATDRYRTRRWPRHDPPA